MTRKAMDAESVAGISRVVLVRRERALVLEQGGEGIVVWTLRFGDEVRPESDYFMGIDEKSDPKANSTGRRNIFDHVRFKPSNASAGVHKPGSCEACC